GAVGQPVAAQLDIQHLILRDARDFGGTLSFFIPPSNKFNSANGMMTGAAVCAGYELYRMSGFAEFYGSAATLKVIVIRMSPED
ncbi:MAG TPA: hypothetical protein PK909_03075, partial [Sphaerochaeta sp.]|nr:hypothetical protein [Sphaerochaeta sp.]